MAANNIASKPEVTIEQEDQRIALRRELGIIKGIGVILGNVIGSGIFISVRSVLSGTGSVGLSLVVWALAGVIATIEGLCYAELGTTFRKSGSTYRYLLEAYPPLIAFLGSFKYLFPTGPSIQSLTVAQYVAATFTGGCGTPELFEKSVALTVLSLGNYFLHLLSVRTTFPKTFLRIKSFTAIVFPMVTIVGCAFLNVVSVKTAARSALMLTILKFALCLVIALGGLYKLATGHTENLSAGFEGSERSVGRISIAFYSALWAYSGGFSINHTTEEVKNVKRTLPICILTSAVTIIILYLLVNISYLAVIGVDGIMAATDAVASVWEEKLFATSFIMSFGVAVATTGSLISNFLSYGRTFYVAAREGHLPEVISYVQVNYYTPIISISMRVCLSIIILIYTDLVTLIRVFGILNQLFSGMATAGLILMRYTKPDIERPFKVPLIIPIISTLKSLFLFLVPLIDSPVLEYMYVFVLLGVGVILYVPLVHYKVQLKCVRK